MVYSYMWLKQLCWVGFSYGIVESSFFFGKYLHAVTLCVEFFDICRFENKMPHHSKYVCIATDVTEKRIIW